MIEIKALAGPFGIRQVQSLALEKGENLAIIGPNGAGKSTLLKLIFGALKPKSGAIQINGKIRHQTTRFLEEEGMSWMPTHEERVLGLTVMDTVALGFNVNRGIFSKPSELQVTQIRQALLAVELWSRRDEYVDTLSAGEYQRVRLARQFALDREILLFDEPFSHLDPQHVSTICSRFRQMSKQGKNIVMTSHDLNHAARCCQRMLLLNEGDQTLFDTTEVVMNSALIRSVFKTQFVSVSHPETGETQLLYPESGNSE